MEDWLSNSAPWIIAATFLLIIATGLSAFLLAMVWKIATWKTGVDSDLSSINSNLDSIKTKFREDFNEIRADLKLILERLPHAAVFGDASPLQLTADGQSISHALDAARWAEDIAPVLAQRVEGMMPYDIQEFCRGYVRDEFRPAPELEAQIKKCAYEYALDRQSVLDVLVIELRDQLLPS